MSFQVLYQDTRTKARVGVLQTKSGEIQTPFFMPVATKTSVKHISSDDLQTLGAKAVICNAFILSLRPGEKVIQKLGGISNFMSFPGVVFTDSGGFQMYSPQLYVEGKKEGVMFRNPFSGEKVFMTPQRNMKIQSSLGSDIAMCLDSMPLFGKSSGDVLEAVQQTTEWALQCKREHDRIQKKRTKKNHQLLFGITQGGVYPGLRQRSAREIASLDFDGFALGGLALGESKEEEYKMIDIVKNIMPTTKPLYLMGAGDPVELLEAVARGVDMFDSRFPTKNARHGTLYTWKGKIMIRNLQYKTDADAIDNSCSCFVCEKYTKAYLRHLLMQDEGTGMRLASYHNLYFLQELMQKAREAIRTGTFKEMLLQIQYKYHQVW